MKRIKTFFRMLGCLALLSGFNLSQAQEYTEWLTYPVPINEANFPDTNFRAYIAESFDINQDGELSEEECLAVQKIDVSGMQIKSLKGICRFIELRDLNASDNLLQYNIGDVYAGDPPHIGESTEILTCCRLENIDFSRNPGIESFPIDYIWMDSCTWTYTVNGNCAVRATESRRYNLSDCPNLQLSWWIPNSWKDQYRCILEFLDISNTGTKTLDLASVAQSRLPECPLFGMNLEGVTITNSDIAEIIRCNYQEEPAGHF